MASFGCRGSLCPVRSHREALRAAALCNDSRRNTDDALQGWQSDPTETALVLAALAAQIDKAALDLAWPRIQEQSFDSERKRMTTFHRDAKGYVAYTKGAPESVLACCESQWNAPDGGKPLDQTSQINDANALADRGLRVLALAWRDHALLPDTNALDSIKSHLQFLGLIALIDPPRPEAAAAVCDCISAGITPMMITGDHPATALAIAHRLGRRAPSWSSFSSRSRSCSSPSSCIESVIVVW